MCGGEERVLVIHMEDTKGNIDKDTSNNAHLMSSSKYRFLEPEQADDAQEESEN